MKNAIMVWTLISSLVGQDAIDAIYNGVLEGKSTDEIMQGIIEKKVRKEKKLDKEKAKGDPFKEEYEKIFGKDQVKEENDESRRESQKAKE